MQRERCVPVDECNCTLFINCARASRRAESFESSREWVEGIFFCNCSPVTTSPWIVDELTIHGVHAFAASGNESRGRGFKRDPLTGRCYQYGVTTIETTLRKTMFCDRYGWYGDSKITIQSKIILSVAFFRERGENILVIFVASGWCVDVSRGMWRLILEEKLFFFF